MIRIEVYRTDSGAQLCPVYQAKSKYSTCQDTVAQLAFILFVKRLRVITAEEWDP